MNFTNEFVNACFSKKQPERLALVKRSDNDYIGPYSLEFARMVSADLGGAEMVDPETGEIIE